MEDKVKAEKRWAISRAKHFLTRLDKAQDVFEIEAELYALAQIFNKSFEVVHFENEYPRGG